MGISLKFYPEYITFQTRWQLKPLERLDCNILYPLLEK